jgi:hypothetical protein
VLPCTELGVALAEAGITHEDARTVLAQGLDTTPTTNSKLHASAGMPHSLASILSPEAHELIRAASLDAAAAGACNSGQATASQGAQRYQKLEMFIL